jgi:hypothetical protein
MAAPTVSHGRDPALCLLCSKGKRRRGLLCDRCFRDMQAIERAAIRLPEWQRRCYRPPTKETP